MLELFCGIAAQRLPEKENFMNRVFMIPPPFQVSDGTLVAPFLNARDCMSGLSFNLLEGVSLASGIINPRVKSKIQIMPHVTQITYVLGGLLEVRMKGKDDDVPYSKSVRAREAVITEAGAFLQLINNTDQPCEVLYIVSPAYLFEMTDHEIAYDDSLVLDESWNDLKMAGWRTKKSLPTLAERLAAYQRLEHKLVGYSH